jgi:hypothetical protein
MVAVSMLGGDLTRLRFLTRPGDEVEVVVFTEINIEQTASGSRFARTSQERHHTGRIGWRRQRYWAQTTAFFQHRVWCSVSQLRRPLTANVLDAWAGWLPAPVRGVPEYSSIQKKAKPKFVRLCLVLVN